MSPTCVLRAAGDFFLCIFNDDLKKKQHDALLFFTTKTIAVVTCVAGAFITANGIGTRSGDNAAVRVLSTFINIGVGEAVTHETNQTDRSAQIGPSTDRHRETF